MVVYSTGGKNWRLSYRYEGKEKVLSLGPYPAVSLKMTREKREAAKVLLAQDIDPGQQKQQEKEAAAELVFSTFENMAREWHDKFKDRWTEKNAKVILARMQRDIFPHIENIPIRELKAPQLLDVARRIADRGALDYAHRALQYCSMVFRYAIANGKTDYNIVADLRGALPTARVKHHATIVDPKKIGELLRSIDSFDGYFPVACALRLAPLVFVRPGELRCAAWDEFDFDKAEWRIPAARMKMKEQHIVPLARQLMEVLDALKRVTGHGQLLFPSIRSTSRPISDNTVNPALRRLGYTKEELTGHGFQSMASTLLNELDWNRDAIERQLAHGERNAVRAAYNFAEFLPERRMMQAWADYLDDLRQGKCRKLGLCCICGKGTQMDKILETKRLCLRKICQADFSKICGILQNEAVMYAWEHTFTTDEVHAWIAECIMRYTRDGFSYWAVIEKASSTFIGVAGIIKEEADGVEYIGIGYIFSNAYWHKVYAYESASACVHYAFETLGLSNITAQIRPTNSSSVRIAEKLGMTVIRPFIRRYRGKDVPHLLYGRQRGEV